MNTQNLLKQHIEINKKANAQLLYFFSPFFLNNNLNYFYYSKIVNGIKRYTLTTNFEYYKTMIETQTFAVNSPIFLDILFKKKSKFLWINAPTDNVHSLLYDNKIWNGCSFYNYYSDSIEIYGFGTTPDNCNNINLYFNDEDKFHYLANLFKYKFHDVLSALESVAVPELQLKDIKNDYLEPLIQSQYISKKIMIGDHALTNRQFELFFYFVKGNSIKECARHMNISIRTAEQHLRDIRNKLGYMTKSQLNDIADTGQLIKIGKLLYANS